MKLSMTNKRVNIALLTLVALFTGWGCSQDKQSGSAETQVLKGQENNFAVVYDGFSTTSFKQHVKVLADDSFAGREPGTQGDQDTREYLIDAFKAQGLKPGYRGSY